MLLHRQFFSQHKFSLLLVLTSIAFYLAFAYDLIRTDYTKLVGLYAGLFFLFYKLVQINKQRTQFLAYIAFGFRALFILAIPNLSQDFYRFIWDGRIILEGLNPYLYTVESFMSNGEFPVAQAQELYQGMGTLNASHYTNYPPINQLCFVIAGLFGSQSILGSVIVMRLLIIAADFGTLHFGKKLLKSLQLPSYNIFWYILNPFIIIELTGNLHFEGVMLFFLIWSLYLIHKGRWQWAAVVFALSISVKLIPLIFLPIFYQWFTKRTTNHKLLRHTTTLRHFDYAQHKQAQCDMTSTNQITTSKASRNDNRISTVISNDSEKSHDEIAASATTLNISLHNSKMKGIIQLIGFYSIVGLVTLLLFAPFFSMQFVNNYAETVALWFQNFEFNASIYYITREIGYLFRGYNEIAIIGKYTAIIVMLSVIAMAFFRKNASMIQLISAMLFALTLYYFTTTTVHPWYLATPLLLSVFTKYKFPLVWSFVIILSYLAYINLNKADKSENLWIIALEYFIVYIAFFKDLFKAKSLESQH